MAADELAALHALRDAAVELLALEADAVQPEDAVTPARTRAADCYQRYVERFGPLNRGQLHEGRVDPQTGQPTLTWRRPNLAGFRSDPHYYTVMALEVFDQTTSTSAPAPILTRRVNGRARSAGGVATADEALAVTLGEGPLSLARVADLLGLDGPGAAVEALGERVFEDPEQDGAWVPAREYLAGDVRAKYGAAAEAGPRYRRNLDALAELVPADLGPLDISVRLGAPWIPASDIEDFLYEVMGGRVRVWHLPTTATWRIVPTGKIPAAARMSYGTSRQSGYELVSAGLNGKVPIVYDLRDTTSGRRRIRNLDETVAAQQRLSQIQQRFTTWVWEDAERCERLCAEYNRRFNTHVVHRPDGSQLTFPGLADGIELWPWQRDIVAQIISAPATMCGHAVGAGKTRSMVCTALTARRLGLAAKPLIAVPSHLVEQVAREARQTYPFGRFLVAGEDSIGGAPRTELAARCATGDWDAVIMSHRMLASLPVDPRVELEWLRDGRARLERVIRAGQGGKFGRGELRRRIAALDARIDRLADPDAPTPTIAFDSLGVDLLLIDEAHYFKRLPVVSRAEGLSVGASQRAADLLMKARTLRARRGQLPSLALFTGTPWSNTITETFVWQTFLQPEVLAAAGVDTLDAWAAVFVDYDTTIEVTPDGADFRPVTRPARIRNLPELRAMFGRCADILPTATLDLDRPDRVEATIVSAPSPAQRDFVLGLAARAEKIRRETVKSERGGDNMLALCGDGRRVALDPRLVGIAEQSTKLVELADQVAQIHRDHADLRFEGSDVPGVFQLVFCDQGTPGSYGPQTYGRIRIELAARGIPAERIRWVHEARTAAARAALFADCRNGAVSVLIGSTDKVGVGTNIQTRLRALHHADAPWRPSDIEQREGRAFRPGNLNPVVDVFRYVTEGTFDAFMWQTLQRKARFIEQLYRTDPGTREIDDLGDAVLTFAEVKALATGNPLLLEQAHAAAEVRRLQVLRSIDTQALTAARRLAVQSERAIGEHQRHEALLRAAQRRLVEYQAAGGVAAASDNRVRPAVDELRARLDAGGGTDAGGGADADRAPVRTAWRGLGIELLPAGGWRADHAGSLLMRVTLDHRRVDELSVPLSVVRQSSAVAANALLRALRGWVTQLPHHIAGADTAAQTAYDTRAEAEAVIRSYRSPHTESLLDAQAVLDEINAAVEASVTKRGSSAA